MNDKIGKFESGHFYHVFNRAVGSEQLFYEDENYDYFINRLHFFLRSKVEFYTYVLLKNHFHLLIRVHEDLQNAEIVISEQFRKFFISYTQAINSRYQRRGGLFMRPFKRIKISDNDYLNSVIHYIHYNPVYHGLTSNFENYPWSSYRILQSGQRTFLMREELFEWFGGKAQFILNHKENLNKDRISSLIIEGDCPR